VLNRDEDVQRKTFSGKCEERPGWKDSTAGEEPLPRRCNREKGGGVRFLGLLRGALSLSFREAAPATLHQHLPRKVSLQLRTKGRPEDRKVEERLVAGESGSRVARRRSCLRGLWKKVTYAARQFRRNRRAYLLWASIL